MNGREGVMGPLPSASGLRPSIRLVAELSVARRVGLICGTGLESAPELLLQP